MAHRSVWDLISAWLSRRAAGDPNRINFTITSPQLGRTYQVEASRRIVRLALGILLGMVVLILVGGVAYGFRIRDAVLLRQVRLENEALREQVERVAVLEQEVQRLDQIRRQLYHLAGVPAAEMVGGQAVVTEQSAEPATVARFSSRAELTEMGRQSPLQVIPVRGPVSRGYTIGEEQRVEHAGIDIAGAEGVPIVAAADGRVTFAGWDSTFGCLLVLRHGAGWETRYGHAQELLVSQGDSVQAGSIIALLGSTGRSSAPHLHFEVHKEGSTVDPADYFAAYRSAISDTREAGGD
jgi:murein DD-endopeptidase MepM/ murein hydrolase activator NlpD